MIVVTCTTADAMESQQIVYTWFLKNFDLPDDIIAIMELFFHHYEQW